LFPCTHPLFLAELALRFTVILPSRKFVLPESVVCSWAPASGGVEVGLLFCTWGEVQVVRETAYVSASQLHPPSHHYLGHLQPMSEWEVPKMRTGSFGNPLDAAPTAHPAAIHDPHTPPVRRRGRPRKVSTVLVAPTEPRPSPAVSGRQLANKLRVPGAGFDGAALDARP